MHTDKPMPMRMAKPMRMPVRV
jgi:hypothetical protein